MSSLFFSVIPLALRVADLADRQLNVVAVLAQADAVFLARLVHPHDGLQFLELLLHGLGLRLDIALVAVHRVHQLEDGLLGILDGLLVFVVVRAVAGQRPQTQGQQGPGERDTCAVSWGYSVDQGSGEKVIPRARGRQVRPANDPRRILLSGGNVIIKCARDIARGGPFFPRELLPRPALQSMLEGGVFHGGSPLRSLGNETCNRLRPRS